MRCSYSTINHMMKDDLARNQGTKILACPSLIGVLRTRKLSMAADPLYIFEQYIELKVRQESDVSLLGIEGKRLYAGIMAEDTITKIFWYFCISPLRPYRPPALIISQIPSTLILRLPPGQFF